MKQNVEQDVKQDTLLQIDDLYVSVQGKSILKGVSLTIKPGEIHAVMGPNGSGKSTLSYVLSGHPKYAVDKGKITYNGKDFGALSPQQRAAEGFFLAFQYPVEVPGVTLRHFLYTICKQQKNSSPAQFKQLLQPCMEALGYDITFLDRQLNVGFSGGEKKRAEVLQLLMLKPTLAVLDETDSGLDVDSLKLVAKAVNSLRSKEFSAIVITHYPTVLEFLKPDYVHILASGKVVASGDVQLAHEVMKGGYQKWTK